MQEVFCLGNSLPDFFFKISLESRHCPESAKVLLVEYGIQQSLTLKREILGFGTRNTTQGIWNSLTIGIQNQSSTIKESKCSTWNLETMAWNPETKTVALNTWGDTLIRRKKRIAPRGIGSSSRYFPTRKNGRARRRHVCLPRARPFSLTPTTSKCLLRRLLCYFFPKSIPQF